MSSDGEQSSKDLLHTTHQYRLDMIMKREEIFKAECNKLARFIENDSNPRQVANFDKMNYDDRHLAYDKRQVTSLICSGGNFVPNYSWTYEAIYRNAHVRDKVLAKEILKPDHRRTPSQFAQAYSIWKYFSDKGPAFSRLLEIFHIQSTKQLVLVTSTYERKFSLRHFFNNRRIVHDMCPTSPIPSSPENISISLQQLFMHMCHAAEHLNLTGVAHRFLTLDTIFITPDKSIKFTAFDFSTIFWNNNEQIKLYSPMGLGIPVTPDFLEHLPPEAFQRTGYDASTMDMWSIGVALVKVVTGANPFEPLTRAEISNPEKYVRAWHESEVRQRLPELHLKLLDDIFREQNERITIFDIVHSPLLNGSRDVVYYRIDIRESINLDGPPPAIKDIGLEISVSSATQQITFNEEIKRILLSRDLKVANTPMDLKLSGYLIDVSSSFDDELKIFLKDRFFRALRCIKVNENPADVQTQPCLVRVLPKCSEKYLKQIASEGVKVLKLCQNLCKPEHKPLFHELYDIFMCRADRVIWVFQEQIPKFIPLSSIVAKWCDQTSPEGKYLTESTLSVMIEWWIDLTKALQCIFEFGAAHRSVKPQNVLINFENNQLKLTHFDMACFYMNPENGKRTPRSRGLPHDNVAEYFHLPPEVNQKRYDPSGVDIWSFGVLMCYCLTGGKVPFTFKNLDSDWNHQFLLYRIKNHHFLGQVPSLIQVVSRIFVYLDERCNFEQLDSYLVYLSSGQRSATSGAPTNSSPTTSQAMSNRNSKNYKKRSSKSGTRPTKRRRSPFKK